MSSTYQEPTVDFHSIMSELTAEQPYINLCQDDPTDKSIHPLNDDEFSKLLSESITETQQQNWLDQIQLLSHSSQTSACDTH